MFPRVPCPRDLTPAFPENGELTELYAGWFVIQVVCRREKQIAALLDCKGYEIFLPCIQSSRRHSSHSPEDAKPLFPGYVFCRSAATSHGLIVTTPGVVRILERAGVRQFLRPEEVRNLALMVRSELKILQHEFIEQGSAVLVNEGPLRGLVGNVVRFANRERIVISLDLLQRSIGVEMQSWQVTPLRIQAGPAASSSHNDRGLPSAIAA